MKKEEKLINTWCQFLVSAALGSVTCGLNGKNLIAVTAVKSGQTGLKKTSRIGVDNRGKTTVYKMYDFNKN